MSDATQAATLFSVTGLVAVITGGGTGLGLMIAKALASNGARAVYILGRRAEPLSAAAKLGPPGIIIPLVGDVTSKDSLKAVAAQVRREQGYINVLFANSGVGAPRIAERLPKDRKPTVEEFAEAMWEPGMEEFTRAMHVNVTGVYYTALAFLELLDAGNAQGNVEQKSQVVVMTSIAGFSRVAASSFAYSVSKAAANHLVKMLATYFLEFGIRVNGIAPGLYPSEMTAKKLAREDGMDPWEEGAMPFEQIPLRRTGSESDMMGLALFLLSRAGAYINGNIMVTDGGRLSQLPSVY